MAVSPELWCNICGFAVSKIHRGVRGSACSVKPSLPPTIKFKRNLVTSLVFHLKSATCTVHLLSYRPTKETTTVYSTYMRVHTHTAVFLFSDTVLWAFIRYSISSIIQHSYPTVLYLKLQTPFPHPPLPKTAVDAQTANICLDVSVIYYI